MTIDFKNKEEIRERYVPRVKLVADDERFYFIKGASEYALSDYGRVYKHNSEDGTWRAEKSFIPREIGCECVTIQYDELYIRTVFIGKLMAEIFIPDREHVILWQEHESMTDPLRWRLTGLHATTSKDDIIEMIRAKCAGEESDLPEEQKGNTYVNIYMPLCGLNNRQEAYRRYWNMISRATNENVKELQPAYKDTTVCDLWRENIEAFIQFYYDNQYYYPGIVNLDKDVFGCGEACYAPGKVCLIPASINKIFTSTSGEYGYCIQKLQRTDGTPYWYIAGTAFCLPGENIDGISCDTYAEALIAGRKRKADYIGRVIDKEREDGYMPEELLNQMNKWRNEIILGRAKLFEPSDAVLRREGVIN